MRRKRHKSEESLQRLQPQKGVVQEQAASSQEYNPNKVGMNHPRKSVPERQSVLQHDMRMTMVNNAGVMVREQFRKRLMEITFGGDKSKLAKKKEKKARQERLRKIV
ncbi:hypothetical protein DVH05_008308 [Phytophthora capsici]|nr:hypothetical protein DVH05_008308 [Phytophthora capsici]